jgi:hypothetical protein
VNASVLDPPDPTDAVWVFPSQLLTVEVLRRPIESTLHPLIGVNQHPSSRPAGLDRHPERVGNQRRGRGGVDRPADHPARAGVQHDGAVQLAFAGGVLGDVGDPQLIGAGAGELAVDQVAGGCLGSQPTPEPWPAGHAPQAGAAHQQLHGVVADADAAAQGELGVDPSAAIGLPGGGVDLVDGVSEPGMADRPRRRRP